MNLNSLFQKRCLFLFCLMLFFSISSTLSSADESLPNKDYIIGAEDVLDIQVWGNDDMHRVVEVSKEGAFTFPLIDKVQAAGLSVFEIENVLKKRLAEGYFVSPQVTITVSKYKSQKVILLGEVKKPGSYIIKGKTHILELISEAEGLTDDAGRTVVIIRPDSSKQNSASSSAVENSENKTITIDLDQITDKNADDRFFAVNGDSIYVGKARRIFVTGEVNKPGEFKWEKELTVHQAISRAGGPTKRGSAGRTRIIRTENGQEKEIKPDLSDLVMPNDIIKVPESYF
jgi:polysaccharide export outer membrane protein